MCCEDIESGSERRHSHLAQSGEGDKKEEIL